MESVYIIPLMSKLLIVACKCVTKTHKFSAADSHHQTFPKEGIFFYQVFVHTLTAGGIEALKLCTD